MTDKRDKRFLSREGRPKGLNRDPFPPKKAPLTLGVRLARALKDKYRVGVVLGAVHNFEFEDLSEEELAKFLDSKFEEFDLDEHSESPSSGQL